jgi:hypothetical protein
MHLAIYNEFIPTYCTGYRYELTPIYANAICWNKFLSVQSDNIIISAFEPLYKIHFIPFPELIPSNTPFINDIL